MQSSSFASCRRFLFGALLLISCSAPQPESPCARDNGGCDVNAVCSTRIWETEVTCACKAGFTGDGHTCTLATCGACDPHATCTSIGTGGQCVCNPGFTGDGHTCTTQNPCLIDNGGCGTTAAGACRFDGTNVSCTCNSGYVLNGSTCSDEDECALSPCSANASCTNTVGSFSCACNDGFSGDGLTCTTIAFCEQQPGVCGVGACHDVPGGHYCTCPVGYRGLDKFGQSTTAVAFAVTCGNINECDEPINPCGVGGVCADSEGSYSCSSCPEGKTYDGITCVEDLCLMDNGGCDAHATCAMRGGAAICTCRVTPGSYYYGDGVTCHLGFGQVSAGSPAPSSSDNSTSCGLRRDNTLWCWGANNLGQYGDGSMIGRNEPTSVGSAAWREVAVGAGFACGIRFNGQLFCWGSNDKQQLGSTATGGSLMVEAEGIDWESLAVGPNYVLALKTDGTLHGWGDSSAGQLGSGPSGPPQPPGQLGADKWNAISTGALNACGIRQDGSLYCWGDNTHGQLGRASSAPMAMVRVGNENNWASVSVGTRSVCAIGTDYNLWCWGDNSQGVVGVSNDGADIMSPRRVGPTGEWASVSVGTTSTCAIKQDATLWCWGTNTAGQVGNGTTTRQDVPVAVPGGIQWSSVSVGASYVCGVSKEDALRCWGINTVGQLGNGKDARDKLAPVRTATRPLWSHIAHGSSHSCALGLDSSISCWGHNDKGQLGDGTQADHSSPQAVGTDHDWKDLMAGATFTCGLKANGQLWCWGALGDVTSAVPVQVGASTTWTALTDSVSSATHACAIASTGKLACWGKGTGLVLGTGGSADQANPISVSSDLVWTSAVRGGSFTCALKADDSTLWCWGNNTWLRMVSTPTQFGSDAWLSVTAGNTHACGIRKTDQALLCWGDNLNGEVGNGTRTTQSTPALIGTASVDWSSVTAGPSHTCAIKNDDDSLWCWGLNTNGQLGLGTNATPFPTSPVQVGSASWTQITAGVGRTCGLTDPDGILWCWGADNYGQTGDASAFSPVLTQVF